MVHTVVTHTAAPLSACLKHHAIKITALGMVITLTTFAGVCVSLFGRSPREVIVKVCAALTVQPCCVVLALTLSTDLCAGLLVGGGVWYAAVGMAMAHTGTNYLHLF